MNKPICMVTGVGDGTGSALVRRFAAGGYRLAMLARNRDRLLHLEEELTDARSFICDLRDLDALEVTIAAVRTDMGSPSILVHNAVSATFGNFLAGDPVDLENNFRVNTTSLLHLTRAFAPDMVSAGQGAIMVTGNTSALRGIPDYTLFAPTKAAQRTLTQSLARDLGPQGVHVAYIVIDAVIDTPWTREAMNRTEPDTFFSNPDDIADEVFHVAHQPRSTWSFDVEIRPFAEKW